MNHEYEKKEGFRFGTGGFLLAAAVTALFLPPCICSVLMVSGRNYLTDTAVGLIRCLCGLIAVILLVGGIRRTGENKKPFALTAQTVSLAVLIDIALYIATSFIIKRIAAKITSVAPLFIIGGIAFLAGLLFTVAFLYTAVSGKSTGKFFTAFKKPFKMLLWTLILLVAIAVLSIRDFLLPTLGAEIHFSSVAGSLAERLLEGIAAGLLLCLAIRLMAKSAEKDDVKSDSKQMTAFILAAVFTVAFAAGIFVSEKMLSENAYNVIVDDISRYILAGTAELKYGSLDAAYADYRNAVLHKLAWEDCLGVGDSEFSYSDGSRDDLLLIFLNDEKYGEDSGIYRYLTNVDPENIAARELYIYILNRKLEKDKLSDEENGYLTECVNTAVAEECFVRGFVVPKDTKPYKDQLLEQLENWDPLEPMLKCINLLIRDARSGRRDNIYEVIDIAEDNPNEKGLQYLAVTYAQTAVSDGSEELCARAAGCVKRYLELCENEKMSEKQLNAERMAMLEYLTDFWAYEDALSLADKIDTKDKNAKQLVALTRVLCYNKLDRTEDLYKTADELVEAMPDDPMGYYFRGVGALKNRDTDKALSAYVKIAEIIEKGKLSGDALHNAEQCLLDLGEYITIYDGSGWTDLYYACYADLTDTQRADLAKSKLGDAYLRQLYYLFGDADSEKSLAAGKEILAINGNLALSMYLSGAVYYNDGNYEKAIEQLRKSLAVNRNNMAVYYILANAYKKAGDYENAYANALYVQNRVSEINHSTDWFGVGYHIGPLVDEIQRLMEESKGGED